MRPTQLSCAVLITLALGCDNEPASVSSTTSAAELSTASSAKAPARPSAYSDEDLPVPPDFEAAAAKEITADNYKAKLAEIVAEITGSAGGPTASASASAGATPKPSASANARPKSAAK